MNGFDLIIFDCDGVLVDSEHIANAVFAKVLNEECGFTLSLDDMFNTFVGHSSKQCMEIIETMLGTKPPDSLEARYKQEIDEALKLSVLPVPGIEQVLAQITIPYCVASGGSHEKMRITLGKTGLLPMFEGRLYSTSDVERGKPFPDIYLHAARSMGVNNPSGCLVIEDSPTGVSGARAAGMTVFGYSALMGNHKLLAAGAHHTFSNMARLTHEITLFTQNSHANSI